MASEEFKNEFKKILKEENEIEVTDEQVSEIIKKFEGALQDKELLNNLELETVSGGGTSRVVIFALICSLVSGVIGGKRGKKLGEMESEMHRRAYEALPRQDDYKDSLVRGKINGLPHHRASKAFHSSAKFGLLSGFLIGSWLDKLYDMARDKFFEKKPSADKKPASLISGDFPGIPAHMI